FVDGPKGNPRLVFASISARQLVKLPGIDDTRVFAQNVRLGLGRTRVNKEILASVKSKEEHPKFLTFHNGLTMVAQQLTLRGSTLTLNKYSVCNGCQSLLTFYDNRSVVSEALEVLVRIVRVGEKRETAESIADQVFGLIGSVNNERVRKYSLTKFILIYLIGELLRVEADGEKLLQNPKPFLELDGVKNSADVEHKVLRKIKELTNFAIT